MITAVFFAALAVVSLVIVAQYVVEIRATSHAYTNLLNEAAEGRDRFRALVEYKRNLNNQITGLLFYFIVAILAIIQLYNCQ